MVKSIVRFMTLGAIAGLAIQVQAADPKVWEKATAELAQKKPYISFSVTEAELFVEGCQTTEQAKAFFDKVGEIETRRVVIAIPMEGKCKRDEVRKAIRRSKIESSFDARYQVGIVPKTD